MYFDYWTKGIRHQIAPLDRYLSMQGAERMMVHIGSWRESNIQKEEVVEGILCRDIQYYDDDIGDALRSEKPTLVYVLNMGGPIDRLVNRLCRNLNIKTVFFMHGVLPTGHNLIVERKRLNRRYGLVDRLLKIPKYLKVYKMYAAELFRSCPREFFHPKTYGHLLQMMLSPGSMYTTPFIDKDLHPDTILVYSKDFKDEFIKNMQVPPERIHIVGNPNLDAVMQLIHSGDFVSKVKKQLNTIGIDSRKPRLGYLADGFECLEGTFSKCDVLDELIEMADLAKQLDWQFILKLHPTNNRDDFESLFKDMGHVKVVQNEVDLSIMAGCKAVIGHISSSLVVPIVLKIPIFIPQWTKVLSSFDYYVSSGAAIGCDSLEQLKHYLQRIGDNVEIGMPRREAFIAEHIGFTDGKSWERIANVLAHSDSKSVLT